MNTPDAAPDMVVVFLLDKSSSMGSRRDQTISAFNEYVDELKRDTGEKKQNVRLSLTAFDTDITVIHDMETLENVSPLTNDTYAPGGMTALLDALGNSVNSADAMINEKKWRPSCLCVILTDGEENASQEFNNESIQALVKEKTGQGNWTFVYLGAEFEDWSKTWKNAQAMGISAANVASYNASNMGGTMKAVARSTSNYSEEVQLSDGVHVSPDFFAGVDSDDLVRGIDVGSEPIDSDKDNA